MGTVLKFDPRSQEDLVDSRKKELLEEWDRNPFTFIKLFNRQDGSAFKEFKDMLLLNALDDEGDVLDQSYDLKKWFDNKKEEYADDMAWRELG